MLGLMTHALMLSAGLYNHGVNQATIAIPMSSILRDVCTGQTNMQHYTHNLL